jgi:LPS sulfotransferase NodH
MQPHISYLICATNRSGSFLLCEALKNTSLAGQSDYPYSCWLEAIQVLALIFISRSGRRSHNEICAGCIVS